MINKYILVNSFLVLFIIYSFLSLYVSRRYGAKIVGWPAAIKRRDYTIFLLAFPETILILNVVISVIDGIYGIFPVIIGFIIMISGMCFNLIVRMKLGKNWVPLSKTTEDQKLVTISVYSKIQHPFYLSVLIMFTGVAVISWNLFGLLFLILLILALIIRIKKEEAELVAKFGSEYRKYIKETPMLIPKLK